MVAGLASPASDKTMDANLWEWSTVDVDKATGFSPPDLDSGFAVAQAAIETLVNIGGDDAANALQIGLQHTDITGSKSGGGRTRSDRRSHRHSLPGAGSGKRGCARSRRRRNIIAAARNARVVLAPTPSAGLLDSCAEIPVTSTTVASTPFPVGARPLGDCTCSRTFASKCNPPRGLAPTRERQQPPPRKWRVSNRNSRRGYTR